MLLLKRCEFLCQIVDLEFSCLVPLPQLLGNQSLLRQFLFLVLLRGFLLLINEQHLLFLLLLLLELFLFLDSLPLHLDVFFSLNFEGLPVHEVLLCSLILVGLSFLAADNFQLHLLDNVLQSSLLLVLELNLGILLLDLVCHVFQRFVGGCLIHVSRCLEPICILFLIWTLPLVISLSV